MKNMPRKTGKSLSSCCRPCVRPIRFPCDSRACNLCMSRVLLVHGALSVQCASCACDLCMSKCCNLLSNEVLYNQDLQSDDLNHDFDTSVSFEREESLGFSKLVIQLEVF